MGAYILRRVLLMIPTILGIMAISFAVIQFAPGGPVEQVIAKLSGQGGDAGDRLGGGGGDGGAGGGVDNVGEGSSKYRGAQGLDPQFIAKLEKQFGFDKPAHERFLLMMKNYLTFEFGNSRPRSVDVEEHVVALAVLLDFEVERTKAPVFLLGDVAAARSNYALQMFDKLVDLRFGRVLARNKDMLV